MLYSRMIFRPLRTIHRTAEKMANLDFSERCRVESRDEIGDLARTLNFLAGMPGAALSELRAANEKLARDLEREKRLEMMRKDFIAGVSHKLKTPIMLIGSCAEGLKYGIAQGEDRREYALCWCVVRHAA
jgi:signal transduction histidine kinase